MFLMFSMANALIELNLAVVKITHKVTRTKKGKK